MTRLQWAKVYDEILAETTEELVTIKDGKIHIGKLFFEPITEVVTEVIEEMTAETDEEIVDTAFYLCWRHNSIAKDGKTHSTMKHWAYMNGVVNKYLA